ncbi:DUF1648 domain-containing protein [Yaniella halotolerans]|uniref:DUF1648 domain-containing protein n=1 Tax=Yaniella halotolerans TaxID=225453 RepID=UPI0003B4E2ED|nr:DUF1648 domain-containing protein [Yaniella halotolerans]
MVIASPLYSRRSAIADRSQDIAQSRVISRFILAAIVLPVVVVVLACIAQLMLLPAVPDPIATHWGPDGATDGFSSPGSAPLMTALIGFGSAVLIAALLIPGLRRGERGPVYRFMGAIAAGTAGLIAVLLTGILWIQRGLDDAREVGGIGEVMLIGFGGALALGLLAWFIQPAQQNRSKADIAAQPVESAQTQSLTWVRYTSMPKLFVATIATVELLLVIGIVTSWMAEERGVALGLLGLALLISVLTATMIAFRVRVDHRGLTVTSVTGLPRFTVPLQDIESVTTTKVEPMAEFGGWGLRLAPKRFGVITGRGPAIQVHKSTGRDFVVTVPDATTGAGVLQAHVETNPVEAE